ncbi:3-keto-disaccharide hydrolase [Novipirellula sp. SH528]|uniref:3-keto-disaccharide hydrolase n=1 Tax=Novipirellula sp. SH528 TaxID=3454466 RepID=UPI003FA0B5FB
MPRSSRSIISLRLVLCLVCFSATANVYAQQTKPTSAESAPAVRAFIDDDGPGWRSLTESDFTHVNSAADTWSWSDGVLHCTGKPVSVLRTTEPVKNFEMVVEWMHERSAGNSGVFVWTTPASIEKLTTAGKPGLPSGIEVQILDHGYTEMRKSQGQSFDWFGTNGDVFPVRVKMTPFPPLSPDGSRSFPRKHLAKGHGHWNHYYIRAINGEVRLWVNGEEVSGGTAIEPAEGYLCLESEGSPIQFRKLRIRELP